MVYISVEYPKTKHNRWAQYFQISSAAISKLFDLGEQAVKAKRDLVSNFIKLNSDSAAKPPSMLFIFSQKLYSVNKLEREKEEPGNEFA